MSGILKDKATNLLLSNMNNYYLDANFIVSFLINRNDKQYQEAKATFSKALLKEIKLILQPEIVIEIEYTLRKRYHVPKSSIVTNLIDLISVDYIDVPDRTIIIESLKLFELHNIDLVDCILFTKAHANDGEVLSFDTDFKKLKKKSPLS